MIRMFQQQQNTYTNTRVWNHEHVGTATELGLAYSISFNTLPMAIVLPAVEWENSNPIDHITFDGIITNGRARGLHLPSSRSVNRAIWGNSLNVSRQITPAVWSLAITTWSCLTNLHRPVIYQWDTHQWCAMHNTYLGLCAVFFPVFLSINAMSCWRINKLALSILANAGKNRLDKNRLDDYIILLSALLQRRCVCGEQHCSRHRWLTCAPEWQSERQTWSQHDTLSLCHTERNQKIRPAGEMIVVHVKCSQ